MGSGPIKKNARQKEKPWSGKKRFTKKMKEKIKGKGNLLGPAGMGATGTAKTSTAGTAETSIVGIVGTVEASAMGLAEKGAESAAGMGATGMAGAGLPTPIVTPGPSKVSTNKEIGV